MWEEAFKGVTMSRHILLVIGSTSSTCFRHSLNDNIYLSPQFLCCESELPAVIQSNRQGRLITENQNHAGRAIHQAQSKDSDQRSTTLSKLPKSLHSLAIGPACFQLQTRTTCRSARGQLHPSILFKDEAASEVHLGLYWGQLVPAKIDLPETN